MSSLHGILLAERTTSINCGHMLEKAVDSIAIVWNLSCSPVGAEVFPNKKLESEFSTTLDCVYFSGVFCRTSLPFLGIEG